MKIALIQVVSSSLESVAQRRERVKGLVRSASEADLIVLPELWAVGYFAFDNYASEAETFAGPTVSELSELARQIQSYIHVGSFVEQVADGALRNTAALIDPQGHVIHRYSKVHVFGYESEEARLLQPGDQVHTADTTFGRVAGTTCYDLRFPEIWRCMVDQGAQLVIVPAAWPAARREHWKLFTSVRAVEEQILVVACNAAGTQDGVALAGHSRVVDPWGTVLVEAGDEEGVTWCEVDPSIVPAVRKQFPVLGDRLPSYAHLAPPV